MLFPGETDWEKCYCVYKNNKLLFLTNIKNHTFKYCYVVHEALVRITTKYIVDPGEVKMRKIDCLMITHRYDTLCCFITVPVIFEMIEVKGAYSLQRGVLDAVHKTLGEFVDQENVYADETNRHAWGKVKIHVG